MPTDRAQVRNAADRGQVARAERVTKREADQLATAIAQVQATDAGRLVMWELLSRAGVFESVLSQGDSRVLYTAGRQDFGHELMALLLDTDADAYLLMESEARKRARFKARETDAAHTAPADKGDQTDG